MVIRQDRVNKRDEYGRNGPPVFLFNFNGVLLCLYRRLIELYIIHFNVVVL